MHFIASYPRPGDVFFNVFALLILYVLVTFAIDLRRVSLLQAGKGDEGLFEFSVSATLSAGHVQLLPTVGAQALADQGVYRSVAMPGSSRFDGILPSDTLPNLFRVLHSRFDIFCEHFLLNSFGVSSP